MTEITHRFNDKFDEPRGWKECLFEFFQRHDVQILLVILIFLMILGSLVWITFRMVYRGYALRIY